jgi:hypothetical protein
LIYIRLYSATQRGGSAVAARWQRGGSAVAGSD